MFCKFDDKQILAPEINRLEENIKLEAKVSNSITRNISFIDIGINIYNLQFLQKKKDYQ